MKSQPKDNPNVKSQKKKHGSGNVSVIFFKTMLGFILILQSHQINICLTDHQKEKNLKTLTNDNRKIARRIFFKKSFLHISILLALLWISNFNIALIYGSVKL